MKQKINKKKKNAEPEIRRLAGSWLCVLINVMGNIYALIAIHYKNMP